MAFARSFLRHTMLFDLPQGEKAACGIAWDNGAGVVGLDQDTIDAFYTLAQTFWSGIDQYYTNQTQMVGSRLQWIGVNGKVVETAEDTLATDPGSGSAPALPTEVACVVSLRSAVGSRRGRGRFYLPAFYSGALTTLGRIDSGVQSTVADESATYLADLVVGASTYHPVVASQTGGLLSRVLNCRVGDVFDSQRRRRDKLAEEWQVRIL